MLCHSLSRMKRCISFMECVKNTPEQIVLLHTGVTMSHKNYKNKKHNRCCEMQY